MRIGFYGGTFDPIHHGHLIMARAAADYLELKQLIFLPNTISPHKEELQPAPPAARKAMVAAAIEDEPGFAMDDQEILRGGSSYAIDTMLQMRDRYPDADFFYLIGEDNLRELHTWRRIEELQRLVQFVVLSRSDDPAAHPFVTLKKRIDISATEIRQRVARGQSIRYLVPDKVLALIDQENLYRELSPSPPNK